MSQIQVIDGPYKGQSFLGLLRMVAFDIMNLSKHYVKNLRLQRVHLDLWTTT